MVAFHQDALEAICEALDNYSDLRSFSLTCSALRPAAIRCLLGLKPVVLTEGTIHAFHRFVFADPIARGQHIRGIDIAARDDFLSMEFSVDIARCFTEIIKSAIHLERLVLRHFSELHLRDPRIIPTLTRLPSLVHLCISKCWPADYFLQSITSPIKTLQVRSIILYPFDSMANLAPTLESIELWDIGISQFSVTGPRFPAVRSLTVHVSWGTPYLAALLHMFPSLSGTLSLPLFDFVPTGGIQVDDLREANKHAQEGLGEQGWKRLDYVHCYPILLHLLNLQCGVHHLALNCQKGRLQPQLTSEVLRRARPTYLELLDINIAVPGEMCDLSNRDLFPPEVQTTVTHLLLFMQYCVLPGSSDATGGSGESSGAAGGSTPLWKTVVNTLCSAIQALNSLAHLRVIIQCYSPNPSHAEAEFIQTLQRGGTLTYHLAAEELVVAAPSLQNIVFTTSSSPFGPPVDHWCVESGWRVTRHGVPSGPDGVDSSGNWQVEELSSAETEEVVRREDLIDSTSRQSVHTAVEFD